MQFNRSTAYVHTAPLPDHVFMHGGASFYNLGGQIIIIIGGPKFKIKIKIGVNF
jgi:hypothetical protein